MAKTKVRSTSNKAFLHPGGKVNISNPVKAAAPKGKGLGTPGGNVGKQTSKAAQPR